MSIKGGAYARFQRSLEAGDLQAVRMAAPELPYVNLADALAVCLLMARQGDRGFERASIRWLARLCLERPDVTLIELRGAATALMELPSSRARGTLADLARRLDIPGVERTVRRR